MSPARDAQVLRERLAPAVAGQSPELVLGPVWRGIYDALREDAAAGREAALDAIGSQRYGRLLTSLDELVATAAFADTALEPASDVLPRLLDRDAERLRRAVVAVERAQTPDTRDVALHEARKKAKRLRYAAESMSPVFGKRAWKVARAAKSVQRALGEHQDSVLARHRLRDWGAQAHVAGENGFTFGRLHALEEMMAADAVREFEAAWRAWPAKHPGRWVTG